MFLLAGTAPFARAEAPRPLSLDQAITWARAQSPRLAASRGEALASRGRARQLGAWPNPELEFEAEDIPADGAGLSGAVRRLGVSQTFAFPGKRGPAHRAGLSAAEAAEWRAAASEAELVRSVTSAFHRTRIALLKASLTRELAEVAAALADAADTRVESGAAPDQERLRAEIVRDRAALDVGRTRREYEDARRSLARLIGRDVQDVGDLAWGGADSLATPRGVSSDPGDGDIEWHPLAREALARREASEHALVRAGREPLPDLTLALAGGRDGRNDEEFFDFRISFPIPLFDRSAGLRSEARALVTVAEAEERETRLLLRESLVNARSRMIEARSQIDAYRTSVLPRAEEALRLVRTGYDAGKFGFLELLDTQRTLFESRGAYLDRLLDYHEAVADLDALVSNAVTPR
jgi:cobalt-zinc-cadmium efflux system outer membrane protein